MNWTLLLKGAGTMKFLLVLVLLVSLQVSACGAAPMNESEFAEVSMTGLLRSSQIVSLRVAEFASIMLKRVI